MPKGKTQVRFALAPQDVLQSCSICERKTRLCTTCYAQGHGSKRLTNTSAIDRETDLDSSLSEARPEHISSFGTNFARIRSDSPVSSVVDGTLNTFPTNNISEMHILTSSELAKNVQPPLCKTSNHPILLVQTQQ